MVWSPPNLPEPEVRQLRSKGLVSTQENYPWIGTDKKVFLCLVSSGLELMTLTQRKIFLSVPIHG